MVFTLATGVRRGRDAFVYTHSRHIGTAPRRRHGHLLLPGRPNPPCSSRAAGARRTMTTRYVFGTRETVHYRFPTRRQRPGDGPRRRGGQQGHMSGWGGEGPSFHATAPSRSSTCSSGAASRIGEVTRRIRRVGDSSLHVHAASHGMPGPKPCATCAWIVSRGAGRRCRADVGQPRESRVRGERLGVRPGETRR